MLKSPLYHVRVSLQRLRTLRVTEKPLTRFIQQYEDLRLDRRRVRMLKCSIFNFHITTSVTRDNLLRHLGHRGDHNQETNILGGFTRATGIGKGSVKITHRGNVNSVTRGPTRVARKFLRITKTVTEGIGKPGTKQSQTEKDETGRTTRGTATTTTLSGNYHSRFYNLLHI